MTKTTIRSTFQIWEQYRREDQEAILFLCFGGMLGIILKVVLL